MSTPTPRTDAVYLEHRYWANEDDATEAIEDLRDLARELERELAIELERATHYRDEWQKESALILNAEMDEQALAKMLGGKLGLSCRKIIAEEVPKLVEENAILREDSRMLEWLLDNCSTFVTVDHTTGEPDIYIIEASREAIRYELEKEMD